MVKNNRFFDHKAFTLVETLVGVALLGLLSVGGMEIFRFLARGTQGTSQSLYLEQIVNEVQELFSDPAFCLVGIEELSTSSPKFCESAPIPVRLKKDLGPQGPSPEDEILVPTDSDHAPKIAGMDIRATIGNCIVDGHNSDKSVAKLMVTASRDNGIPLKRELFIQLKYKTGDHAVLESCQSLSGQGSSNETDDFICTNALGGTWDGKSAHPCKLAANAQWFLVANVTPLQASKKYNDTHYEWNLDPAIKPEITFDAKKCEFRLRIEYPKTTQTINQKLIMAEGLNRFVQRNTNTGGLVSGIRAGFLEGAFAVGTDPTAPHYYKIQIFDKIPTTQIELTEIGRITFDSNIVFSNDATTPPYSLEARCP